MEEASSSMQLDLALYESSEATAGRIDALSGGFGPGLTLDLVGGTAVLEDRALPGDVEVTGNDCVRGGTECKGAELS